MLIEILPAGVRETQILIVVHKVDKNGISWGQEVPIGILFEKVDQIVMSWCQGEKIWIVVVKV
jgi:hypothetical protein